MLALYIVLGIIVLFLAVIFARAFMFTPKKCVEPENCEVSFDGDKAIKNLAVAGRCTSVNETLWDVMRVIPCCAVTGRAAGTAIAMSDDLTALDVKSLQAQLVKDGVVLHEKDLV